MKNKLKLFILSIFIFAMVFAFAACSAPVVGEWKTTTYTIQWMQGSDPYDAIADNVTLELTINNDKTWESCQKNNNSSDGETLTGTWTFEDNKITMVSDNDEIDDVMVLEYKDGKLYGTQVYTDIIDGQTTTFTYVFERK